MIGGHFAAAGPFAALMVFEIAIIIFVHKNTHYYDVDVWKN